MYVIDSSKQLNNYSSKTGYANEFMKFVQEWSKIAHKSLHGTLMSNLKIYEGSCTMHEHVIEMATLAAKLRTSGMKVVGFFYTIIPNPLPPKKYRSF